MRPTSQYYLIAIIIAVILIGAGVGAGYLLGHRGQSNSQSTSSSQQSSSSATASATPTQQATLTATPSATPAGILTNACQTSALRLSLGQSNGAAGSIYYPIVLTNTSTSTCTLNGYPGVSLVNASGAQIGQPADRDTTQTATSVTLAPQASAAATLRVVQNNFDPGVCKDGATQLKIYPPGNTTFSLLPTTTITQWCPGLTISPVQKQ